MLTANEIGEKIAIARKMKNLSQAELSEKLSVSAQAVGKWERGESMPDIIMFSRLAEILGTDVNYFIGIAGGEQRLSLVGDVDSTEKSAEKAEKSGWDMSGENWVDADFSGLHGLGVKFSGANIKKCRFVGSEMSGLVMKGNNIQSSDFTRSDMSNCKFSGSNLQNSIFIACNFSGSVISKSNVLSCDYSEADLTGVTFRWSNVKRIKLAGAIFRQMKFQHGQLTEVTFDGELTDCSFENCDFAKVVFDGAVLRNCFFKSAKLKRAKLIHCKADQLTYAFMKNCKADMSDVTLIEE